ncbi:MAG: NTP pyrophosphohydrolases including oxidative damage repair enzymes [uncultured Nocardioidaceae bacterium]|uniref:NTP pyrophosphohydrolases including oxidative damage repair enzymes n=1 Tax=uncultured Nocardioidaceae bacterium TaxID=253824 RepID=A0A6J4MCM0_9ACTN|nr:MAG: NTP pyrophosphohydrolases including oxidative damage repair enzymes [uncultured Nocardioidaceae bacterium]
MSGPDDPYGLERFLTAQEETYEAALAELRRGRKTSHWMWFVFPQLRGLGRSPTAQRYAVSGLDEARAYLVHPVLGPRLDACTQALLELAADLRRAGRQPDPVTVLGPVDATKLRSSMTLFARAAPGPGPFTAVLDEWFAGEHDPATLGRLPPG